MTYEPTGKKTNKDTAKHAQEYDLKRVSTSTLLWTVVKRHKFMLVSVYAGVITALYLYPPLVDTILSII